MNKNIWTKTSLQWFKKHFIDVWGIRWYWKPEMPLIIKNHKQVNQENIFSITLT